jgi:hypothetical protein
MTRRTLGPPAAPAYLARTPGAIRAQPCGVIPPPGSAAEQRGPRPGSHPDSGQETLVRPDSEVPPLPADLWLQSSAPGPLAWTTVPGPGSRVTRALPTGEAGRIRKTPAECGRIRQPLSLPRRNTKRTGRASPAFYGRRQFPDTPHLPQPPGQDYKTNGGRSPARPPSAASSPADEQLPASAPPAPGAPFPGAPAAPDEPDHRSNADPRALTRARARARARARSERPPPTTTPPTSGNTKRMRQVRTPILEYPNT